MNSERKMLYVFNFSWFCYAHHTCCQVFSLWVVMAFCLEINMLFLISGIPSGNSCSELWVVLAMVKELCSFLNGLAGACELVQPWQQSLFFFLLFYSVFVEPILNLFCDF